MSVPMTFRRPSIVCGLLLLFIGSILSADHFVGLGGQLALGVATLLVLVAVARRVSAQMRTQVVVVVATASCFEVLGSLIWGVYRYRLGNLPLFVPPGHGIVYLTGVALSQCALVRRRPTIFVYGVLAFAAAWGVLGLSGVLGRVDVVGAFGVLTFSYFLLRSGVPAVLAGVFVAVAALEIYGTAIGAWRWVGAVPGLGLPDGNPPSGAASGYALFDLAALSLAPWLLQHFSSRPAPQFAQVSEG
jgi:hypothetical protein